MAEVTMYWAPRRTPWGQVLAAATAEGVLTPL